MESINNKHFKNLVYLKRNRYIKPKENFQYLIKILKKDGFKKKKFILLDIGCANGELIYNLSKNFKNGHFTGIDIDKSLLLRAKKKNIDRSTFIFGNISKSVKKKFDIVICSGVLGIFKNGKKILENIIKTKKKSGRILIFDNFNKYGFNLNIKATSHKGNFFKNIYSLQYVENFFKKYCKKIKFYPFNLKTKIKKNPNNLLYNWTEKLSKKNIITSGLGLIQNQYWVKIY